MFCSTKQLKGYEIAGRDGEVGKVREVYFDDQHWVIRHLVVDTGGWLSGRRVLVSPHAVQRLDHEGKRVVVNLSRRQIEDAPGVDTHRPVSRQQEIAHYDFYGYPYYWAGTGLWGPAAYPLAYVPPPGVPRGDATEPGGERKVEGDPHLRSTAEITGYHIEASDGSIGHVDDFLFEQDTWRIRELVVATRNWLPGEHVMLDPSAIGSVDWAQRQVRVDLTREQVKSAPKPETVL